MESCDGQEIGGRMINKDNISLEEYQKLVNKVQENTERTMNETMPVILEQAMNELTEDEVRELKEGLSNILSSTGMLDAMLGKRPKHEDYEFKKMEIDGETYDIPVNSLNVYEEE